MSTPTEIKAALAQHRLWTDTDGEEGARFALREVRGAGLGRADLRDADLGGSDLGEANLYHADLWGVNLHGANLHGANLSGAYIRNANLSGANLTCADLTDANLSDANLSDANLLGADLSGALLPPPTMLLLARWGRLPHDLVTDCMRYDASLHPHPEAFDTWATGGTCPHVGFGWGRAVNFTESRGCWPGLTHPVPNALDLMLRLFEAKGVKR